jgi:hypothetical protein
VQSVSGVLDTFAPVGSGTPDPGAPLVPPRSPILFSYHKDEDVHIVDGRAPAADDEIAVDADFLQRNHAGVGDKVTLQIRGVPHDFTIAGTFDLPGVDLTGIPMAAMSAAHQSADLALDRIDVNIKPGASPTTVREAIAGAVGAHWTVVPPSTISFADQRLAQIEIQRAYWALLSPDANERSTSGVGASNSQEKQNYDKYSDLAKHVELRVENVTFLSSEAAVLTFRIYYGDSPSPIIHDPQTGAATRVDGHWQLATSTLCSLAALVGIKCEGDAANVPVTPPNGGARVRNVVAAGVQTDQAVSKSDLTIAGWRSTGPGRLEILYSLQTTGGPSTPWPSTAIAQKNADGHWYALRRYACGIQGLASGGCYTAGPNPVPVGQTSVTAEAVPVRP